MCHLFSVEFQKFLQPSNFFSVCSYNCFALSNKNTLPLLSPLSTPPLLPASLRQWLYSHQPLIMFSAHFLSLARLHFSLKIHNSSCDHGTPPRIQLSTSGRGGGGQSTNAVRIWKCLKVGGEAISSTSWVEHTDRLKKNNQGQTFLFSFKYCASEHSGRLLLTISKHFKVEMWTKQGASQGDFFSPAATCVLPQGCFLGFRRWKCFSSVFHQIVSLITTVSTQPRIYHVFWLFGNTKQSRC